MPCKIKEIQYRGLNITISPKHSTTLLPRDQITDEVAFSNTESTFQIGFKRIFFVTKNVCAFEYCGIWSLGWTLLIYSMTLVLHTPNYCTIQAIQGYITLRPARKLLPNHNKTITFEFNLKRRKPPDQSPIYSKDVHWNLSLSSISVKW